MKKLWHTLLIVVVLALLIRSCYAQQLRLKVHERSATGYGGCVYIGNAPNGNWIYATAAHNVRNAINTYVMLDGGWRIAGIVEKNDQTDAALIVTFPGKKQIKCYHFGSDARRGEEIMLRGLVNGVKDRSIKGKAASSRVMNMESAVNRGDSGSPLFRANSELVGIQSAMNVVNNREGLIVPASVYRGMIAKRWKELTCIRFRSPIVFGSGLRACRVELYSGAQCGACQQWKRDELPKLLAAGWRVGREIVIYEDDQAANMRAGIKSYPTFIGLHKNKERKRLVGYAKSGSVKALLDGCGEQRASLPPVLPACDCKRDVSRLRSEVTQLRQQLIDIEANRPVVDLSDIEQRLTALEPLLNRRLQLLNESGEVTADRTYKPGDVMKIRGVYKAK